MTTRTAITATLCTFLGAIVLGLGMLFLFVDPSAADANARAALVGQGFAMFCMIPLGIIWIMWAVRFRKDREQPQRPRPSKR